MSSLTLAQIHFFFFAGFVLIRQSVLKLGCFNQIADAGGETSVQGWELGSAGSFRIFCGFVISGPGWLWQPSSKTAVIFSLINGGDKTLPWKFSFGWSGSALLECRGLGGAGAEDIDVRSSLVSLLCPPGCQKATPGGGLGVSHSPAQRCPGECSSESPGAGGGWVMLPGVLRGCDPCLLPQGHMDEDVQAALLQIIRMRQGLVC